MKKQLILTFLLSIFSLNAMGWGAKGHDITAYIAEKHLSKKALKSVTEALEGKSMVYYSSWMDNMRGSDEYSYTTTWHYRNVDEGFTPQTMPREPKGDVQTAIDSVVEQLKSGVYTDPHMNEKIAIKMLVHLVGDLHCPMHAGRKSDLGGNRVKVTFFGNDTSLHSIWDTPMIEYARKWSYSEWQEQIDRASKSEVQEIVKGSTADWYEQTYEVTLDIYDSTPAESKLSYGYLTKYSPILEQQLLYGGIRLAHILNEIYK